MALTALAIPSQVTEFPTPFDALTAFTDTQTLTATGYLNNLNSGQIDLGGAKPVSAVGRVDGIWSLLLGATNFGTSDESYTFRLLGSNDVAFGNGNVELLAMHDVAATAALRNLATILGATPTMPPTGLAGTLFQMPFTNLMQRIYYRYLRCHLVVVGTGPSVVATSWISRAGIDV
jgi:hypothetical protein